MGCTGCKQKRMHSRGEEVPPTHAGAKASLRYAQREVKRLKTEENELEKRIEQLQKRLSRLSQQRITAEETMNKTTLEVKEINPDSPFKDI